MTSVKRPRYKFRDALKVAADLVHLIQPYCRRIQVVGSLRRELDTVKDIEILFTSRIETVKDDLFGNLAMLDITADLLDQLVEDHLLEKRPNINGHYTWGKENRFAIHPTSGLAVDLFCTDEIRWWNALVMRTGGKRNNINIANAARRLGWTWEVSSPGFRNLRDHRMHFVSSESDCFDFVGLKYLQPQERP